MEEQIIRIVDLSRWRDGILEAPMLDLEVLDVLVTNYEEADMLYAAADLHRGWICY
jgi:hypothetical protein